MKPISPVRCVIYDCDGVYSIRSIIMRDSIIGLCGPGRAPVRPEELPFLHMHTVQEALPFLFPANRTLVKKAQQFILTINPNDFIPYMKMEPNLLEALDT